MEDQEPHPHPLTYVVSVHSFAKGEVHSRPILINLLVCWAFASSRGTSFDFISFESLWVWCVLFVCLASGVESILPLLEDQLWFAWFRRAVVHVFGDQALLISNDPVLFFLAFGHLDEFSSSSSFSSFLLKLFVWWCWQCTHQGGDCEHKVDKYPCVFVFVWWVIDQRDPRIGWVGY